MSKIDSVDSCVSTIEKPSENSSTPLQEIVQEIFLPIKKSYHRAVQYVREHNNSPHNELQRVCKELGLSDKYDDPSKPQKDNSYK